MIILLAVFVLILDLSQAIAFSTKWPMTSADCTQIVTTANLQTAINSTNTGTICVQSGTVAVPVISANKDIAVVGPATWGGGGTATLNGGAVTWSNTAAPWKGPRLSGFTITLSGQPITISGMQGFRLDHNVISQPSWVACLNPIGALVGSSPNQTSPAATEGVVDHNTMTNCRFTNDGEYTATNGWTRWTEPLNLGSVHNVYYEDNTSTQTGAGINNFTDSNVGGRYVARFNNLDNTYFEAHSIQGGDLRSNRLVEIYGNVLTLTTVTGFKRMGFFRGGTGIVFNNLYKGSAWNTQDHFQMDNVRSIEDPSHPSNSFGPWGWCEGPGSPGQTVSPDGDLDSSGYPCRDQPGVSGDVGTWSAHPNAPVNTQTVAPWLFWGNTTDVGVAKIGWELNSAQPKLIAQIVDNRDAFQDLGASCFGGAGCTSGIGSGTAFPATCTPVTNALAGGVVGPYFWKTNEGSWNTTVPANTSGLLYKCTSTNTWTLYYTPYTYPHTLVQAPGSTGPFYFNLNLNLRRVHYVTPDAATPPVLHPWTVVRTDDTGA